ncbi:hypothetical protein DsansV1_C04g0048931 [Dioscorea sansibarensis]
MRGGGTTQGAEANQGNKRRPWIRLEVSGGGILVIGGVIIAAALAARRGHVNKQRNKRKTTPGTDYEQYHKEKEEEVKDSSIINGYGEITTADGLVEIKKTGSMTEVDEKLCLCQSHTEEREEWKEEAETVVGLKAYEIVEKQDDRQEVGEEKVSACAVDEELKKEKEDDACAGVGEGEGDQISMNGHGQEEDQLSDEMLFVQACNKIVIHVEDDAKQVDEDEQMEFNTKLVANDEVLEEKESCGEETESVVEELGKGEAEFQPDETNEEEGELSSSTYVVLNDEVEEGECDCREKGCNSKEEEESPLVKEELLHGKPAVNTEEVQEDECDAKEEPATESCEEETSSSDDSGASSTENETAVWPAEVLEDDETKAGQLATSMLNRRMMMMMTVEKKKGKAFLIYMNHSLLVLAMALALALLSFHLSHLTVP